MRRRRFIIGAVQLCTVVGCGGSSSQPEGETGGESASGDATTGGPPTTDPATSASGGGSTTCNSCSSSSDGGSTDGEGATSSGSTGGSESGQTDTDALCDPTPDDIEGPFYRDGIPDRTNLDIHGDSGELLTLEGIVFGTDCQPIPDAVVEIWHCTPLAPGDEAGDGPAEYDASGDYRYYGRVVTDADGNYAFSTLKPAWYLNGMNFRPSHIHLKVWREGVDVLTTQVYFADDPFADTDPWFNEDMAVDPDEDGAVTLDIFVLHPDDLPE